MWKYVAKIIAENGDIFASEAYERYQDAQVFAWKSKSDPVSIVITQIDETGMDVMDHWLKRLEAHAPIRDVPLHPIARTTAKRGSGAS
jgi:hypothetical protein